jgi:hypothetical protein
MRDQRRIDGEVPHHDRVARLPRAAIDLSEAALARIEQFRFGTGHPALEVELVRPAVWK